MNGFIRFFFLGVLVAFLSSCTSRTVDDDSSLSDLQPPDSASSSNDEDFSELDEPSPKSKENKNSDEEEIAFEDEAPEKNNEESNTPLADDSDLALNAEPKEASQKEPAEELNEKIVESPAPEPEVVTSAPSELSTPQELKSANITDLQFKANETGGTVVVQADGPLSFSTRKNADLNQFIVEVENANLPQKLKRTLNTKDIKGSVGSIDAYQNPGSRTARFVLQLREGVGEPVVQVEGNTLLIVANGSDSKKESEVALAEGEESAEPQILPGQNLTDFLAGNSKFYGKKISVETNNIDIRDALNLIAEESGVNMVVAEEVRGPLSLKLRQVPWDQALVVIMRAKKLGYTRQGNVLRIAPLIDLKAEEDDANRLAQARKTVEPLRVRMFSLSYAKVEEMDKKIKDFLGERGRVVADSRTNSIVVTDIQENLDRVGKLLLSLDRQPPQVLIESKIVEAQETFTRNIGISWGASGNTVKLGSTAKGPINLNPGFSINPASSNVGNFNFNLSVGTLDFFGTLQAALSLVEIEDQVKVISAPRIMAMSNEKAEINQTTEVPVRKVTQSGTSTQESFEFKPLSLKLEVTPQVTADGSVVMKVLVNRQFRGGDVSSAGQGAFAVNSREANTRVLVKNGQTAVIGGIYQSDAVDGENGVPWLREIPIINNLFRSSNSSKAKSELLVFLTPRIIGPTTSEASSASSSEL